MFNIFGGANEDDVVDVSVHRLATAFGEVEEEESSGLSDVTTLALTHGEARSAVVLISLAEAEVITDAGCVEELIVVGGEVEGGEVRTFLDHVADVVL